MKTKLYFKRGILILIFFFPLFLRGVENDKSTDLEKDIKRFFNFTEPPSAGFFALFHTVLGALDLYERGTYSGVKVNFNSGVYLDLERGSNWWEYFFEPLYIGKETEDPFVPSIQEVRQITGRGLSMSRTRGFQLIQKYIHLKPEIEQRVDDFVEKHFSGYFVIAIHHRGTDKKVEVPIVPYEKTVAALNAVIARAPVEVQEKQSLLSML